MSPNQHKHRKDPDAVRRQLALQQRRAEAFRASEPQQGGASRFLHERAQRWVFWARKERGMPSGEDVRALVASGELAEYKNDPAEVAQEYAYEAMESPGREAQHDLALRALHFDDTNADARRVVADMGATSHIDRVGRLKKIVMDEEARLAAVLPEFAGRVSDAVEVMPLLRARFDLGCALWAAGRVSRALRHFEALYAEDEDDVVGVRYPLLMTRLHQGDHEGAAVLLDRAEAETAELLVRWARVLQLLLAGKPDDATALYDEIRQEHAGEATSLASPPPPEFAFPGFFRDEIVEYAAVCLRMLHWAWHQHPDARAWLLESANAESGGATTLTE